MIKMNYKLVFLTMVLYCPCFAIGKHGGSRGSQPKKQQVKQPFYRHWRGTKGYYK